jgi:hypothetical protein
MTRVLRFASVKLMRCRPASDHALATIAPVPAAPRSTWGTSVAKRSRASPVMMRSAAVYTGLTCGTGMPCSCTRKSPSKKPLIAVAAALQSLAAGRCGFNLITPGWLRRSPTS